MMLKRRRGLRHMIKWDNWPSHTIIKFHKWVKKIIKAIIFLEREAGKKATGNFMNWPYLLIKSTWKSQASYDWLNFEKYDPVRLLWATKTANFKFNLSIGLNKIRLKGGWGVQILNWMSDKSIRINLNKFQLQTQL